MLNTRLPMDDAVAQVEAAGTEQLPGCPVIYVMPAQQSAGGRPRPGCHVGLIANRSIGSS
jgi:hypothetical protein